MSATDETRKVLTVPEVAHELRLSRASIYRAIERGELKPVRLGGSLRVAQSEVDRLIGGGS